MGLTDWRNWLRGLIGAFIQGGATSISTMIVDPQTFNIGDGLGNVMMVSLVSAIVGAALFLQKKPIPGVGV